MTAHRRPASAAGARAIAAAALLAAACAAAQPLPAGRTFGALAAGVPPVAEASVTRELRVRWTDGRFTLLGQVRFAGAPRGARPAEPSPADLVIVVRDAAGRDLDWRTVPNPRLAPGAGPGRDGLIAAGLMAEDEVEILIHIPEIAGAERIEIFAPVRNGGDVALEPLGALSIAGR